MSILLAFMAGVLLGVLFFAGLWLTVRAIPAARHPVLLALGSFWTRTVVTLGGFLLVARSSWQNALACLAGFLMGRLMVSSFAYRRHRRCT